MQRPHLWGTANFAPTCLEEWNADLAGKSIAPFLRDKTPDDWTDAFYSQMNGVELYYSQRVAATKGYKTVAFAPWGPAAGLP